MWKLTLQQEIYYKIEGTRDWKIENGKIKILILPLSRLVPVVNLMKTFSYKVIDVEEYNLFTV